MSNTTIADLVLTLQAKDQAEEVEYVIVAKSTSQLVAVNAHKQAQPMIKFLKLIG